MSNAVIEVEKREESGKGSARRLRREGKIPAVVYGAKREAVPVTVDAKRVGDVLRYAKANAIFLLQMKGTDAQRHVMIRAHQIEPMSRRITHLDFIRIVMDVAVKVQVPIELMGTAPGVKIGGGILEFVHRTALIECLPGDIPDHVEVDISHLEIGHQLRISDIPPAEKFKVIDDADQVVVVVAAPQAEPVAEEVAVEGVVGAAEPEVIKKTKKDEDEAAAAEKKPAGKEKK